jgi:hypothetical protein
MIKKNNIKMFKTDLLRLLKDDEINQKLNLIN